MKRIALLQTLVCGKGWSVGKDVLDVEMATGCNQEAHSATVWDGVGRISTVAFANV